jgi:YfiH family protein
MRWRPGRRALAEFIRHPLLDRIGVPHGFGVIDAAPPAGLLRVRQVHGIAVAIVDEEGVPSHDEADAVVSCQTQRPVGVMTADCVPILAAARDGSAVAAIHAGWRGLGAGVVEAGISALRVQCGGVQADLVAVIGPHIGASCYEVDAPVLDTLRARFGEAVDDASEPTRPGHRRLALGDLVALALGRAGVREGSVAMLAGACTSCDARRFHSYRRDGEHAGRLVHHISARAGR